MDRGSWAADQAPENQWTRKKAPNPKAPAASEETWKSGSGAHSGSNRKLWPDHDRKNSFHQARSRWKPSFRRIGWSSRRKADSRLIIRRRKDRPCGASLQAWWRWPINDSNSLRLQERFRDHSSRRDWIRWRVIPQSANFCQHLSSWSWQAGEFGGPRVWKSSRSCARNSIP